MSKGLSLEIRLKTPSKLEPTRVASRLKQFFRDLKNFSPCKKIMAEDLLLSIMKTKEFEGKEELCWRELTRNEKLTMLAEAQFDIDFFCLFGPCESIFNADSILEYVSNLTGKFVEKSYLQRLQGCPIKCAVILAELKPFKLGLVIDEESTEEEETMVLVEPESNNSGRHSAFLQQISSIIQPQAKGMLPFRDIRNCVINNFLKFEIVLFQFGQKQPLDLFLRLQKDIPTGVRVAVAMGMEFSQQDSTVLTSPNSFAVGETFYPMFLSQQAGSLLFPRNHAKKLLTSSQRLVSYSTLHHQRKFINFQIDLNGLESPEQVWRSQTSENDSELCRLTQSLRGTVIRLLNEINTQLQPMLSRAKCRLENYFEIEKESAGNKTYDRIFGRLL